MSQGTRPHGPSFLPVPSALVTFPVAGGARRIFTVGWLGVVCAVPPLLTVWFRPGANLRKFLRPGDLYVVNLPGEELMQELAGRTGPDRESKPATPCLSPFLVAGEEVQEALPLAVACPVRIECRCRCLTVRFSQYRLSGEVLAVHLDGQRQELPAPVDICRLLSLQGRHYPRLGASWSPREAS